MCQTQTYSITSFCLQTGKGESSSKTAANVRGAQPKQGGSLSSAVSIEPKEVPPKDDLAKTNGPQPSDGKVGIAALQVLVVRAA